MTTVVLNRSGPDLFAAWQEQIGRQRGVRLCRGPRPFGVVNFHYRGYAAEGLVELSRLRIDVLHDQQNPGRPVVHRFARYTAGLVADGVMFGGTSRRQFEKNLSLTPSRKSSGRRIGAKDAKLMGAALELDKYLERCSRFTHYPRRNSPRLPRIWVGLTIQHPTGSGPEFECYCRDTGWPIDLALTSVRRLHRGNWLYPMEFVLHHGLRFRGVYADMSTVARRQVVCLDPAEDLIGRNGAYRFDFWTGCYAVGPY